VAQEVANEASATMVSIHPIVRTTDSNGKDATKPHPNQRRYFLIRSVATAIFSP
jgi:hypothetical protein